MNVLKTEFAAINHGDRIDLCDAVTLTAYGRYSPLYTKTQGNDIEVT